jgi:chaperonin GroES
MITKACDGSSLGGPVPPGRKGEIEMKLKPLQDRVLIRRIEEEEQIRGGIVVPDTAKEKPQEGEVIAVGDGKVLESGEKLKMALKKGDRVLFGKYSGTEVKLDDEEYLIMREDDVLGILKKK